MISFLRLDCEERAKACTERQKLNLDVRGKVILAAKFAVHPVREEKKRKRRKGRKERETSALVQHMMLLLLMMAMMMMMVFSSFLLLDSILPILEPDLLS